MPDITIRLHVLLYPDQGAGQPWPCPADVEIQLKRTKVPGARAASPDHQTTTAEGAITSPVTLPEGHYQVSITDPRFTLWEAANLVAEAPKEAAGAARAPETSEAASGAGAGSGAAGAGAGAGARVGLGRGGAGLGMGLGLGLGRRGDAGRTAGCQDGTAGGLPPYRDQAGHAGRPACNRRDRDHSRGRLRWDVAPCSDGTIFAVRRLGPVMLQLASVQLQGQLHCPPAFAMPYTVSAASR